MPDKEGDWIKKVPTVDPQTRHGDHTIIECVVIAKYDMKVQTDCETSMWVC
jgi:hypothetical protein